MKAAIDSVTPESDRALRYLVIDDDTLLRERLVKALTARGALAYGAESLEQGMTQAEKQLPDRVVLDLRLPDGSGLSGIEPLRAKLPRTAKILMLTGFGAIPTALAAVRAGAVNFLMKPATLEEIIKGFEPQISIPKSGVQLPKAPTLDQVERDHIDRVLQAYEGNVTKAAAALGIHRRSLQRKLTKTSS